MIEDDDSEKWKGSSGDEMGASTAERVHSSQPCILAYPTTVPSSPPFISFAFSCFSRHYSYLESLRLGRAARKRLYEYTLVYP